MKYSVLIMTYYKRFDIWLKPLIIEIKRQRPEVEIVLCVNGELDHFDEEYRKAMLEFVKSYSNIFPIFFPRFRSFSRMCNLGIQFASNETVLVLSDDLTLEDWFFNTYEHILKDFQTFGINMSFSSLSVTKRDMIGVGWFDERFLGLGWEDGEFMGRYFKYKGQMFPNTVIHQCKNVTNEKAYNVHNSKLASYMKDEKRLEGQKLDTEFSRYSKFNHEIFMDVSLAPVFQYPLEAFYLDNKHKL